MRFKGLILGLAFGLALPAAANDLVVGRPAPPITLHALDGSEISVESLRGKVVVLNFWATWCVPCRE
jgi:thiol-disulfide isomerase/thioredoxin